MSAARGSGLALLLAFSLVAAGCAGARGNVRFDSLEYPASMSGYLYGPDDRTLSPLSLQVVSEFEHGGRMWGVLYSWVPLTRSLDVSDAINREIEQAGGEGVINLSVTTDGCAINYIPALSLLPIWPGCADVTVAGEIVRRKSSRPTRYPASPSRSRGR